MVAVVLALLGMALIMLGSYVAILAPGDGQTGMVAYPCWLLGGAIGLVALNLAGQTQAATRIVVWLCAILALASVGWSFLESIRYSASSHQDKVQNQKQQPRQ